ncbi:hypothetical protein [Chromobacterium violaceum]|uniref:hypothetical protein n=1 Tax=Chromobacterium violaceum TaxID=536 RepID=UPI001C70F844|nr:hypothetical protein [Chromobacterium violaceum]
MGQTVEVEGETVDFRVQTVDGLFSIINDLGGEEGSIHGIFSHPPTPNGAETGGFRPFSLICLCQCHNSYREGFTVVPFERGKA